MKEFKLPSRRGKITNAPFGKAAKLFTPEDQPPFFIRGIQAGSKEEYWASLALEKIEKNEGYRWQYQVPIWGGRSVSGGLVIDFIVYTPGQPSWVSPMGRYWHTGKHYDLMDEIDAAVKNNARLIAFFTDITPTKEIMYTYLKSQLT